MTQFAFVDTPLGDALVLHRMVAREQLGRLYTVRLELLAKKGDVAFKDLIGKPMTVHLQQSAGGTREWNGIVSDLAHVRSHGRQIVYAVTLRPKFWLLSHRTNCRIFQDMNVPDIASEILREHGVTDVDVALTETYAVRDYCVQYRESDFAFISRLFEQVGIYYYFEHQNSKHVLRIVDAPSAHKPTAPYAEIVYRPFTGNQVDVVEAVTQWSVSESLEPGSVVLDDFDFVKPKADLTVKRVSRHVLAKPEQEIYDYPGPYVKKAEGEALVRVGLEELYARQALVQGEGPVRGMRSGSVFTLAEHPRADQNRKHLIVETTHEISGIDYESNAAGDGGTVRCEFIAIDAERPFRAERSTPRPFVHGPQTAVVVGKAGEEIWTDEHGRVKLKFHWDRNSKNDESVSCWVRVAQLWAGSGFGALHVPRIGQEVVVEFLEGDPDRPLVTGRLYNGDNRSPYQLPAHADHSGIKSRSTKGGGADNANELRFEDTKDKERILFHAQKDMVVEVEHDENDTIDHDRTTLVKNDEKVTVEGNRTEEVKKDEKITIVGNRTEEVKKDEKITIVGNRTEEVQKNETITIKGEHSAKMEKSSKTEVTKDVTLNIKGKRTTEVTMADSLTVQELTIDSKTKIVLKTPGGSITLGPTGLEIKALMIKIEADTQCEVGGKVMLKLKSTGPSSLEGLAVDVKGTTMVGVSGLMVKIG